jgi:5-methylcytosine-specific restriction protein A
MPDAPSTWHLKAQPRRYRDQRHGSASSRGYDSKWSKAAAEYKAEHPWCLGCAAIGVRQATEVVDHIEPHKRDQKKFWNRRNWQPACMWHHNAIKPMLEAKFEAKEITVSSLQLDSEASIKLSRAKQVMPIGADGWL